MNLWFYPANRYIILELFLMIDFSPFKLKTNKKSKNTKHINDNNISSDE